MLNRSFVLWASRAVWTASLGSAALGCNEVVDSDAIRTQGMHAGMTATTNKDGDTNVAVRLRVGGPNGTEVNLVGDDKLVASLNGGSSKSFSGDDGDYSTKFRDVEGGEELLVSFTRSKGDVSAPDSFVTIAEPFELELDDGADVVVRGRGVPLVWDAVDSSDEMQWELKGDCVWRSRGITADDGRFVIPAADVDALSADEDCDVKVTLRRVVYGSVDSNFEEGGEFVSIQERSVTFFSKKEGVPPEEQDDVDAGADGTDDLGAGDAGAEGDDMADSGAGTDVFDAGEPGDMDAGAPSDAGSVDGGS